MPVTSSASGIKAGTVAYYAANSVPAGWLECAGQTVSRTTYAALFNVIGTTYGAGDGSTTFTLPNLRGEFIRGLDNGRGVDAARVIGSSQAAAGGTDVNFGIAGGGSVYNVGSAQTADPRPRNVAMLACIKV